MKSDEPFALAGVWEPPPRKLESFVKSGEIPMAGTVTVITTTPNEMVQHVHDRMPVILPSNRWLEWTTGADTSLAESLLVPFPHEPMQQRRVSQTVNSARNETPECLAPFESPGLFEQD
jgi:putative SOS response-associated peptidase YedK